MIPLELLSDWLSGAAMAGVILLQVQILRHEGHCGRRQRALHEKIERLAEKVDAMAANVARIIGRLEKD